jgi:hypothetical protein
MQTIGFRQFDRPGQAISILGRYADSLGVSGQLPSLGISEFWESCHPLRILKPEVVRQQQAARKGSTAVCAR